MRKNRMKDIQRTAYSGEFTENSKKRLSRCIDILLQISKVRYGINEITGRRQRHQLSFITLSIQDNIKITAQEGYELLLKHFLQWIRRTKKVNTYIWKAEFQTNGQLHYHITTPAWIHYQEIKDKWNNLLEKSGLHIKYFTEHGHYNANSTDIHTVKKARDIDGYLKKEYYKSIQNQKTTGKIWDASDNLKSHKYFTVEYDLDLYNLQDKMIEKGLCTVIELEQCKVIKPTGKVSIENFLNLMQIYDYDVYKDNVRNMHTKDNHNEKHRKKRLDKPII